MCDASEVMHVVTAVDLAMQNRDDVWTAASCCCNQANVPSGLGLDHDPMAQRV